MASERADESAPEAVPALSGRGLKKAFGDVVAVDGVDLEVFPGEVVGLIGPNGAGKTTLLSLLAGLLEPDAGSASIAGKPANLEGGRARAKLGFVSGDTQLYERLTAREALRFYGGLYGLDGSALDARLRALVDELEIEPFVNQRIGTLSSGQTQRVNLARALIADPDVLVLDEPTNALDVVSQRFVLDAVKRARLGGRAVLFASHIMGEVEALSDRVMLLEDGRITLSGTIAEVRDAAGEAGLGALFAGHAHEVRP